MIQFDPSELMNIVFVGHVDHGKSTLVGRLLAETGSLPEGKLEQVRENCERNSKPFEYAFLLDALKEEQSQGITIDAARVFFKTQKRKYLIIDAPGHKEFLKNMVTGASRAEAAFLVIDAQEGVRDNSKRHGFLLGLLGIKKIAVLINKMDLVSYNQELFDLIVREYSHFLKGINIQPITFIPVSGRDGENITAPGSKMPWYSGDTLLTALDAMDKEKPVEHQAFRMPVQDVYKFTLFGDNRRIIAGRISSGAVQTGDEVIFYPSGKRSTVKSIEGFNAAGQNKAGSPSSIGFTLADQVYVQRGEIAARTGEDAPRVSDRFRANIFWLGKSPLVPAKDYWIKIGTAKVKARLETVLRLMDTVDLNPIADRSEIGQLEAAECVFTLNRAIAFDPVDSLAETSRFVIVDRYEICGGGIILEGAPDSQAWIRDGVLIRNNKWLKSDIAPDLRAERYNQRATLVLITGQKEVGRKKLARALEARLFEDGKIVYYLGMGSVLYGVDADLKHGPAEGNQQEHIRRFAEVGNILLDAGMILIVSAVELTQTDLEIIKTVIDGSRIKTIWVGDPITTDLAVDVQIPLEELFDHAVLEIKKMLQENGIIFAP